jgi:hypothetical protein
MKDIYYDIKDFDWDATQNTFVSSVDTLYPSYPQNYYEIPFPNYKSKFYIKNYKTNGFRRFIYLKSIKSPNNEDILVFSSEDNIKCNIIKKIL